MLRQRREIAGQPQQIGDRLPECRRQMAFELCQLGLIGQQTGKRPFVQPVGRRPGDKVGLGSKVVVICQDTQISETYHLVFGDAENFDDGHVTMSSPIGKALVGKAVGEVALLRLPARTRRLRIVELFTIHDGAKG